MLNEKLLREYGVRENNPLPAGYHDEPTIGIVPWTSPALAKIERLRLLSDPGFPYWDVSYCHGRLKTGEKVVVELPFSQLLKREPINAQIVKFAQRDRVYAKGLDIFNAISTLN